MICCYVSDGHDTSCTLGLPKKIVKRWFKYKCEKFLLWYMKVLSLFTHKTTNRQLLFTDAQSIYYGSCSKFRESVLGHCSD